MHSGSHHDWNTQMRRGPEFALEKLLQRHGNNLRDVWTMTCLGFSTSGDTPHEREAQADIFQRACLISQCLTCCPLLAAKCVLSGDQASNEMGPV
jgi:hypothetical protein